MGEETIHELKQGVEDAVRALARASGAKTYVCLVAGDGLVSKIVSANLKAHERGLVDEIEKASANPVLVWEKDNPSVLKSAQEGLAKSKHTELHSIVAVMIDSVNKLNNHKVSRSMALKDSSSIPKWWPLTPKKYAERTQQLTIKDLTLVIDAIFKQVRRSAERIEKLRSILAAHFKTGSCSLGTRAVFDAYFDFLLDEACGNGINAIPTKDNEAAVENVDVAHGNAEPLESLPMASGDSGNPVQTGFAPLRFQSAPTSTVLRPQPIHQDVPESIQQELRVQSSVLDSKLVDKGVSPTQRKAADASRRHRKRERAESNVWDSTRHIFSVREYAQGPSRKRSRLHATPEDAIDSIRYSVGPLAVSGQHVLPTETIESASILPQKSGGLTEEVNWTEPTDSGAVRSDSSVSEWHSSQKVESTNAVFELRWPEPATQAVQQSAEGARAEGCELQATPVALVARRMPNASTILGGLVRSPSRSGDLPPSAIYPEGPSKLRADLSFVVGTLVKGLNRILSSQGSSAPSTVPIWFPDPVKYQDHAKALDKGELLQFLDVVFQAIRGEYFHVRELKAQWHASKSGINNLALLAAIDAYLDAMELEAAAALISSKGPTRG